MKAKITVDRAYGIDHVSEHLYDAFVEHLGRDVYGGLFDPDSPQADEHGFRKDLLRMVKELKIPQVRYPGGNFSSGYRWEDGIGPAAQRPRRLDLAFQSIETNRFGTDEFMAWCAAAGVEPMMAVNTGTRGIEDAQNLFEYCNFPGGTAWSDRRVANGRALPYGVKTWCLGNEMDGVDWQTGHRTAEDYGKLIAEIAKVYRWIDPTVEIIACGSASPEMPTLGQWEKTVLDYAFDRIDLMDMHIYDRNDANDTQNYMGSALRMDRFIEDAIASVDYARVLHRGKKRINLAFNEWNTWFILEDTDHRDRKWTVAPSLLEDHFTMEDAIVVGDMMLSMLKRADRVKTACLSQLVNVNAPIMTEAGGNRSYKQPTYYPFLHASLYGRGTAIQTPVVCDRISTSRYSDVPMLSSVSVWNEEQGELTVFAINRSVANSMELTADLRSFEGYRFEEHILLTDRDPKAHNSFDEPKRVAPVRRTDDAVMDAGMLTIRLSPMSWNVIRLRMQK